MPPVLLQGSRVDYRSLADFRFHIRRFLRFSEEAARAVGLEPQQHQLLLAVKGLPEDELPTIKSLANRLQLRHHTVIGLIDRLERAGLLRRTRDETDQRRVLISLTPQGERVLGRLSEFHTRELQSLAPLLADSLRSILLSVGEETTAEPRKEGRHRKSRGN